MFQTRVTKGIKKKQQKQINVFALPPTSHLKKCLVIFFCVCLNSNNTALVRQDKGKHTR